MCLVLGVGFFAFLEAQVIRYSRTDRETEVSAVVILGAGVNDTVPSLSLQVRLEAALDYLRDKPDIPIVVTGSRGPGEEISEARCMADWLIARGVPEDRILLEEQADNTVENIQFSQKLLADKGTQILCRANKQVKKINALGNESVSTIHQAKGLEYDNVILIDFPFNDEEGLNIAYVGMTRAKNILCIADFDVLLYLICNEELTLPTNKLF